MAKALGVIDINGRRYEANSGAVIDGVRRLAKKPTVANASHIKPKNSVARPKTPRAASSSARAVHSRQQKSQTLLRSVVFKPSIKLKTSSPNTARVSQKANSKTIDPARQSRSRRVSKHPLIDRFGIPQTTKSEAISGELISPKAKKRTDSLGTVSGGASAITSNSQLERLLDEALLKADAHKQSIIRSKRGLFGMSRRLSFIIAIIVLVITAALIIWINVPVVAVKVAATRSHISAGLPTYTPSGYGFDKVSSHPSKVLITYKASGGRGAYTLGEQSTSLDSKSLGDDSTGKSQVQTSETNGTTVYIYGPSNNAAWINNGILYTIKNQASLNSDQILQIAQSL